MRVGIDAGVAGSGVSGAGAGKSIDSISSLVHSPMILTSTRFLRMPSNSP
jgi:hypothetical protein